MGKAIQDFFLRNGLVRIRADSNLYILRGLILILLILLLIMRSVRNSAKIKKLQQNSKTNFAGIDGGK